MQLHQYDMGFVLPEPSSIRSTVLPRDDQPSKFHITLGDSPRQVAIFGDSTDVDALVALHAVIGRVITGLGYGTELKAVA